MSAKLEQTSLTNKRIVIVGAGHAGGTVAAMLREYCPDWSITMVGEEPEAPYQRPPLSKAWLKGGTDADALTLKTPSFYIEHNIALLSSVRADRVNALQKKVWLSDGSILPYDYLVLATGSRAVPIRVPGADLGGVLSLRSIADAKALKAAIRPGETVAVLGAGYVGLEVAATCRTLGMQVVVLEREVRVLSRVACGTLSSFMTSLHEAEGVRFELGVSVVSFEGSNGRISGVKLADGRTISCSVAVVGIGAVPNQEIAEQAGLECDRGILVNLEARTSEPTIFAIGDVSKRPMPLYNCMFRMESVPNALEQAKQAACAIAGRPAFACEVPWQWSDQFDTKLQFAGYPFDADSELVRGDPDKGKFSVFHLKGDAVRAIEAINSPAEFMAGRALIGSGRLVDRQRLVNPLVSMKEVIMEHIH
ncbi:FAD-dependent oxidoreductase [Pseudomonas sp. Z1-14]|uniref:NAD(P)/FAD-dependent oxidoreductase n=1 Tax=Pseudomonas sp. Z1-14 TaxID=2817409 RepID=UPI003DA7B333